MGVIQRMGMVATDADDRPKQPITIHSAKPFRGPPPPVESASAGAAAAVPQLTA